MSDPASDTTSVKMRRYLTSRKNAAGMAGAITGGVLHIAGLVGDLWPVAAVALYGVGALVMPGERAPDPTYATVVRNDLTAVRERVRDRRSVLPHGVPAAVERMLDGLTLVLDRLDDAARRTTDLATAPDQLATAGGIVSTSLPTSLDAYLDRPRSASPERAAAALAEQLDVIARAVDRLVDEVPDVHVQSSEALTEELRRQYPPEH